MSKNISSTWGCFFSPLKLLLKKKKDSHLATVYAMYKSLEISQIVLSHILMRVSLGREFPFEKSSNFPPMLWLTVDRKTKTQTKPQCMKQSAVEARLHLLANHQPVWEIARLGWAALVLASPVLLCSDACFGRWRAFLLWLCLWMLIILFVCKGW